MRVVATLLTVGVLLGGALQAAAQTGPRPVTGPPPSNRNTVTGGSSTNTNANSNSQFLSGSNTGVNNGSLEIYAGSEPYQGLYIGGGTTLPQLPGIISPPSNFSQPYRPDAFVNTPPFLPTEMTLDEAKQCRDAKGSWYGGSRDGEAPSIKLFYTIKPETPPSVALTMSNYVGTAMAQTADGPFLAALCEAAYRALRKGATVGLVEFNVRPKNTMFGLGFGSSGGATGLPAAGAHPYAIAATLGFGTGWSNQRVEGEVVLQLTALRGAPLASTESGASSAPAASAVTPPPAEDAVAPGPGAMVNEHDPSAAPRVVIAAPRVGAAQAAAQVAPTRPAQPAGPSPEPSREAGPAAPTSAAAAPTPTETAPVVAAPPVTAPPVTAPPVAAPAVAPPAITEPVLVAQAAPAPAPATTAPAVAAPAPSPAPTDPPPKNVAYHPAKRLARVRAGQSKDQVFGHFSSMFDKQGQKIVEIQGMRLRASGRSATGAGLEVGEVRLADEAGETLYWFLFSDGRLLAWGRPEQWGATATKYGVELPYHPSPLHVEAKVDLAPGR
jgi:hypothetical protein